MILLSNHISGHSILPDPQLVAAKYEAKKHEFEKRIEEYAGDNPIALWLEYIGWIQETYVTGGQRSPLLSALERGTKALEATEKYRNDERFLKMWILYADLHRDPEDVFKYLIANNMFPMLAMFYRAYALVQLSKGRIEEAENTLLKGIELRAEPVATLRSELATLPSRAAALREKRRKRNGGHGDEEETEPPRAPLQPATSGSGLRGLGGIRSAPSADTRTIVDENISLDIGNPITAPRRPGAVLLRQPGTHVPPIGTQENPSLPASATSLIPSPSSDNTVPQAVVLDAPSSGGPLELIKRPDEALCSNFTIYEDDNLPSTSQPQGFAESARMHARQVSHQLEGSSLGYENEDGEFVLDETQPAGAAKKATKKVCLSIEPGFGPILSKLSEEQKQPQGENKTTETTAPPPPENKAEQPAKGWSQLPGMKERSKENAMPTTKWSELNPATVRTVPVEPPTIKPVSVVSTSSSVARPVAVLPGSAAASGSVIRPLSIVRPAAKPVAQISLGGTASVAATAIRPVALSRPVATPSASPSITPGFGSSAGSGFTIYEDETIAPKPKAASLRRL